MRRMPACCRRATRSDGSAGLARNGGGGVELDTNASPARGIWFRHHETCNSPQRRSLFRPHRPCRPALGCTARAVEPIAPVRDVIRRSLQLPPLRRAPVASSPSGQFALDRKGFVRELDRGEVARLAARVGVITLQQLQRRWFTSTAIRPAHCHAPITIIDPRRIVRS